MLCCLPGLALHFVWSGTSNIAWHHPCWGTIPLTWARGAGSPHTSTAEQHIPGWGLRGSSAASPHGAAPHSAWAALCTGASSGEGTGTQTGEGQGQAASQWALQVWAAASCSAQLRAAPLGFRHLNNCWEHVVVSCFPVSRLQLLVNFFTQSRWGVEISCNTEHLLPSVMCIPKDIGFHTSGPYV